MNKTLRRAGPEPPATRGLLGEVAAAARRAALGVVPGQRGLVSGCLGQLLELPSLGWGGCPALTLSEMALWTGAGPAFNTKPGITWPEPDPPFLRYQHSWSSHSGSFMGACRKSFSFNKLFLP